MEDSITSLSYKIWIYLHAKFGDPESLHQEVIHVITQHSEIGEESIKIQFPCSYPTAMKRMQLFEQFLDHYHNFYLRDDD